jgi:hypothetical protein
MATLVSAFLFQKHTLEYQHVMDCTNSGGYFERDFFPLSITNTYKKMLGLVMSLSSGRK